MLTWNDILYKLICIVFCNVLVMSRVLTRVKDLNGQDPRRRSINMGRRGQRPASGFGYGSSSYSSRWRQRSSPCAPTRQGPWLLFLVLGIDGLSWTPDTDRHRSLAMDAPRVTSAALGPVVMESVRCLFFFVELMLYPTFLKVWIDGKKLGCMFILTFLLTSRLNKWEDTRYGINERLQLFLDWIVRWPGLKLKTLWL
jgi:hypothetical protein